MIYSLHHPKSLPQHCSDIFSYIIGGETVHSEGGCSSVEDCSRRAGIELRHLCWEVCGLRRSVGVECVSEGAHEWAIWRVLQVR